MAKVAKIINAGDNSINVSGNTVSVKISAITGNLLELKSDGLFVGHDDKKIDTVQGNAKKNVIIITGATTIVAKNGGTITADTAGGKTFHAGLSDNRGVKIANHFLTKYTDCPAVLVETAFIDNPNDAKLLVDREDDFAASTKKPRRLIGEKLPDLF